MSAREEQQDRRNLSNEGLRLLIETSPDIISVFDAKDTVMYQSPSIERILGHTPQDRVGKNVFDSPLVHPDDLNRKRNFLSMALKASPGVNVTGEFRLRHADGSWHHVEALGSNLVNEPAVRGIVATYRDVTEHKRAEETGSRLAAIVESSEDAIIGKTLEGIITSWNKGAERTYGYSAQEAVGRHISFLVPTERLEDIPAILEQVRQGENIKHYETERVNKDGSRLHVSLSVSPIRDAAGEILGASTIARDVTEQRRAREELRLLNQQLEERVWQRTAQLEEANKELKSFSYSIAHDVRAPLRHIGSFGELLEKRAASTLDETSQRYLKMLLESNRHAEALLNDLLSFSRISGAEMSLAVVDTDRLVREEVSNMRSEMEGRNISWKVGELPKVRGNPPMLLLAWRNLLSNALKYTRPRQQAAIEVGSTSNKEEVVFFVRDNGVGFDMRYVHKLFGVFQRLHHADEFEGTGIGLAMVQRIVNRHGGRAWAEGHVGSGATFYFSLPLATRRDGNGTR